MRLFATSPHLATIALASHKNPLTTTTTMPSSRSISKIVSSTKANPIVTRLIGTVDIDGAGTTHALPEVDPFMLLDSATITKTAMPPFGAHPHRGHSVVTVLLQGKLQSWDSFRPKASIHTIQGPASYWVDAGTGLFHDEISVMEDESDESQHVRLLQLWISVKEDDRQKAPRVQYEENLPAVDCVDDNGTIVGTMVQHVGGSANIETPHPVSVLHIQQHAGTTYRVPVDPSHGGFVAHMSGTQTTYGGSSSPTNDKDVLVLEHDASNNNYLEVTTSATSSAEYVVCTGERIQETWAKKLAANGAIVAATPEEARELVPNIEAAAKAGKEEGGSFAPYGM